MIDPCAGSGSTLRAAMEMGRNSYGFEISKEFYRRAKGEMLVIPNHCYVKINGDAILRGLKDGLSKI